MPERLTLRRLLLGTCLLQIAIAFMADAVGLGAGPGLGRYERLLIASGALGMVLLLLPSTIWDRVRWVRLRGPGLQASVGVSVTAATCTFVLISARQAGFHPTLDHGIALLWMGWTWMILALSALGWGCSTCRLLGCEVDSWRRGALTLWMGWAAILFVLQFVHLFSPIGSMASWPIVGLGLIQGVGHSWKRRRPIALPPAARSWILPACAILLVALGLSWIASRALLPVPGIDLGLYHLDSVRWAGEHRIVPGLGNLHGRLAFNQSYFLFLAMTRAIAPEGLGLPAATSFVYLMAILTVVAYSWPLVTRPALAVELHPYAGLAFLAVVPALAYIVRTGDLGSPSPDPVSSLLQVLTGLVLLHAVGTWLSEDGDLRWEALWLTVVAAISVTVKLSNLVFSASLVAIAQNYLWRRRHFSGSLIALVLVGMISGLYALRGLILSGAPLYPSALGYRALEWSIPIAEVTEEARWIYAWARRPGLHWSQVIGSWDWFPDWMLRAFALRSDFAHPVVVAMTCLIATVVLGAFASRDRPRPVEWLPLLPAIAGLLFWFSTAPDPRFATGLLIMLSIASSLMLLSRIRALTSPRGYALAIVVLLFWASLHHLDGLTSNPADAFVMASDGPMLRVPAHRLAVEWTDSGLRILTPIEDNLCWGASLPCTPYFDSALRLRDGTSIAGGFTVR